MAKFYTCKDREGITTCNNSQRFLWPEAMQQQLPQSHWHFAGMIWDKHLSVKTFSVRGKTWYWLVKSSAVWTPLFFTGKPVWVKLRHLIVFGHQLQKRLQHAERQLQRDAAFGTFASNLQSFSDGSDGSIRNCISKYFESPWKPSENNPNVINFNHLRPVSSRSAPGPVRVHESRDCALTWPELWIFRDIRHRYSTEVAHWGSHAVSTSSCFRQATITAAVASTGSSFPGQRAVLRCMLLFTSRLSIGILCASQGLQDLVHWKILKCNIEIWRH